MIIFESARLKLTFWYILISFSISIFFSVVIFFLLDYSLEGSYQRFEHRYNIRMPAPPDFIERLAIQRQEIDQIENQTRLYLIYLNLAILGISGFAGYFFSGQALKPIRIMVDDQDRFVADASHEIKTPLTAIKTEIEVSLRDKNLTLSKAKQILKNNLKDVDSLKDLSNNLLTLTRNGESDNNTNFTKLELSDIINTAYIKVRHLAAKRKIVINLSCPDIIISGNKDQLTELVIILLDNAIKYGNKGGKIIVNSKKTDGHVEITVKDNGIGIDKQDIPYVFDRFYRADKSRSKNQSSGYGLGLSIAKQIVQLHRGTISVESEHGKGTVFSVRLPLLTA